MKKILTVLITTILILSLPNKVNAAELEVTYGGGALPSPLFDSQNMMPGDSATKIVNIKNTSTNAKMIAVKGIRTSDEEDPDLAEKLNLFINGVPKGTVKDLFDVSGVDEDGLILGLLGPGEDNDFEFEVVFDIDAGNDYQGKQVVFDLIFGFVTANNLVINEVYYNVAPEHGLDSPKDRNGGINLQITGNAAGSTNAINLRISNTCVLVQSNIASVINNIVVGSNTGNNRGNVVSGNASTSVNIANLLNINIGSCKGNAFGINDEWVELYNPTDADISLKNWTLTDNSGKASIIHANKIIKAGGFALVSKDASLWRFWDEDKDAVKVELGQQIGDGLENDGDFLILKNPEGADVDFVAWGKNIVPEIYVDDWSDVEHLLVPAGHSIERIVAGFDTDLPSDWQENSTPSPGN